MRLKVRQIKKPPKGAPPLAGVEVTVKGWIRTARDQKTFTFVEINDGSIIHNLQVVIDNTVPGYADLVKDLNTGASIEVKGELKEGPGEKKELEIHARSVTIIGQCDAGTYPLQKKRHSFEFLRTIGHLRPRTNTLGAVARVRHMLAMATHLFFSQRGFVWVPTPIITASDCEGAGKMFRVTTIDPENPPKTEKGNVDWKRDFFEKPAYLTVSGQLNGEIFACALGDIYTFGPTFRAENSNTSRHLAEFWMIEPEMAFADLNDNMENAEAFLKFTLRYVFEHCIDDLEFFDKFVSKGLVQQIQDLISTPFERATYSYAIRILEKSNKAFEYPVKWGLDLQSEHERYLTEEFFKKPVILTDYPKEIKSFYMRQNEDEKTVAAMDVLVPKIGEIIGGSQREERLDVLEAKIRELGLKKEDYWWYLALREYGSVPHAGYGVGFERLMQLATGMENIRDVIPFPRYPGSVEF